MGINTESKENPRIIFLDGRVKEEGDGSREKPYKTFEYMKEKEGNLLQKIVQVLYYDGDIII